MENDILKCIMLIITNINGKRETSERIELQNQESILIFGEKEKYKYLRILEVYIGQTNWVFAHGPGDQGLIPCRVIPKTQKWYLMSRCLTLSSALSGKDQG